MGSGWAAAGSFTPWAQCLMKKLSTTKPTPMPMPHRPSMLNTFSEAARDAAGSVTWPPTVWVPAMPAIQPPTYWATDEERNHTAIMNETTLAMLSLVISDRPTGERNSSPVVWNM